MNMGNQIDKSLERACLVFPYLPYILRRIDISSNAGKKSWMKWTKDGMISINIDPVQASTDEQFDFVLLHEVGHIIYAAHLFRDDPRWKESKDLANVAMDLIINETITEFDNTYRKTVEDLNSWSFEFVKRQFGVDLNLEMTWMEIYDLLKPHIKFIYMRGLVDDHSDDEDDQLDGPSKEIVDALLSEPSIGKHINGLNVHDMNFKKEKKLKHEKFKMMLSKFLGTIISFDKKSSILKPNRRSNVAVNGYKKDKRVNALIAVDTSGSIGSYLDEVQKSFSIILNYCDTVDLLPFNGDAGQIIKDVKQVPEFKPGGGTNFHCLESYPSKYDVMIVVSDMECDPPKFKEDNVIYISKNKPDWVKGRKFVEL